MLERPVTKVGGWGKCGCESERCGVEKEKKGGENARIRVLLLKLCPADPEVWRVRCFVVGSLPVFVSCDMPL